MRETADPVLIAYRVNPIPARLITAPVARPWMDGTGQRFAYRCLPLLIANQAGWFLLNPYAFHATWDGSEKITGLRLDYPAEGPMMPAATSHFGHGILTWHIPYLFRTSPGYNLLVRGPANWPKDGATPLEGIVETDWAVMTFTMNWQMTAVNRPVTFDVDEPFCMVVPCQRNELEQFHPEVRELHTDPEMHRTYQQWITDRARFLSDLIKPDSVAWKQGWQKHYFRGTTLDGDPAPDHDTQLRLREFVDL